jgi:phosphatidylglycerophosphate synthase
MALNPSPRESLAQTRKMRTHVFNVMDYFHWPSDWLVKILYPARVSPHQVIAVGLTVGLAGAFCLALGVVSRWWLTSGGFLLFLKNVLDKVDGSLARVRGQESRLGRFYDSLADFAVSLTSFCGVGYCLYSKSGNVLWWPVALWACLGSLLQCSYFVFYQVAYITRVEGRQACNRLDERVTAEDLAMPPRVLRAQRFYNLIYGWQDRLVGRLDAWARWKTGAEAMPDRQWFGQKWHLAAASFLGLGTHIALLFAAAVFDGLEWYLCWASVGGYLLAGILFFGRLRAIKRTTRNGAVPGEF